MPDTVSRTTDKTSPYLLLTTTMVLWGSGFSSSKQVVEHLPHPVAATLRFGGGALVLLAVLRLSHRDRAGTSAGDRARRTSPRDWARVAGAGVLGVFAYNMIFFWGLSLAPAIDGSIIVPVLSPVLTTSFLLVMGRERASAARIAGLCAGAAGAVVFFIGTAGAPVTAGGGNRLAGDALFLLSAACWAAFTLTGPRVLAGIAPLTATTYAMLTGAVLLGAYAAPSAAGVAWSGVPASGWLNLAFLVIGPTAVANLFYYRGIRAVGPASASIMMFVVPVFGIACSAIFLGESFGAVQAVGAAVLLIGAVLAVSRGRSGNR
ncbi:EamA family transporter [Actinoplanes sp. ATCC 53533]|uniref:DMT family transporter n=1 Tax=Actinoplanes sp. ATCC 53533 TaxID=1288362 RepID=UPI000F77AC3C|nr:DMT family transporter [Actinoplanes sp. ATCC 53533]RSM74264.1 EamA family transporter [Actinoplanes sp. ATCC 53533]